MRIEVLVATMNQNDYSLPLRMNVQSDAIIGNQLIGSGSIGIKEFNYAGNRIKYLSFPEKGVGLNRNNALMRSSADICVLADDDEIFVDGYTDLVQHCFSENPKADVIIFNLIEDVPTRFVIDSQFKVGFRNFMRFGAARIAFRREKITKNGIFFNLHFGGGAQYSAGEDTLFLHECLKKGLTVIAVPYYIARLTNERNSTWFSGYTKKYFADKGALFQCIESCPL